MTAASGNSSFNARTTELPLDLYVDQLLPRSMVIFTDESFDFSFLAAGATDSASALRLGGMDGRIVVVMACFFRSTYCSIENSANQ